MNKAWTLLALFLLAACLTGCRGLSAPVVPPGAWAYTHYKAPLSTHWSNDFVSRKGTAKTHYLFVPWPLSVDIAWGDATLHEACKDGGIQALKGADYEYMSVLGLYKEFTVCAYGD